MIRLSSMGDIVLTTGVLEHWRTTRGLRVTCVTRDKFAPLLERHPAVIDTIPLTPAEVAGLAWAKTARRLSRQFRGTLLIDLHGSIRSRALALQWAGPVARYPALGLDRRRFLRWRSAAAGRRLLDADVPQRYAAVLDSPPPPREALRPRLFLSAAEVDAARDLLCRHEIGAPLIALHPYATHPLKTWPLDTWIDLAHSLDAAGWEWMALGQAPRPFLWEVDRRRDLTNCTDLRTTAALLACASVLITPDSGPLHLAEAVGTPAVALFGPTAREWGFYPGGPRDTIMELPMPCRPCSLHGRSRIACGQECLRGITPGAVVETAKPFMQCT